MIKPAEVYNPKKKLILLLIKILKYSDTLTCKKSVKVTIKRYAS